MKNSEVKRPLTSNLDNIYNYPFMSAVTVANCKTVRS